METRANDNMFHKRETLAFYTIWPLFINALANLLLMIY